MADQAKPTCPFWIWHSGEGHHSSPAELLKSPLSIMSIFVVLAQSPRGWISSASPCGRRIPRGTLQSVADAQDTTARFIRARNKDAKPFA
ncbi:hypothetical protein Sp245p_32800 (plasmid) [Azospirillum baldaniorum]|uniref:Uncharacterized protein n=1 Tax=Azospirillum baldaniorum TaxID=1064539 RepID=A0A9P1K1E9_9PROT|nr:hypothetical protein Sp245p_32800 [Azospirillum baldaniorum]CCD03770.1 protein of unknown function [Azospirillum baldaniorum]